MKFIDERSDESSLKTIDGGRLNNQLKLGIGVIRHRNCLVVLYSLTKYSAIFAEVKGYFGITAPDNQLGRRSLCSLKSKNRYQLDNQLEVVVENGLI